jgi:hypothetical protein
MTVQELINRLGNMPNDARVYLQQKASHLNIEMLTDVVDMQLIVSDEYGEAVVIDGEVL